MVGIYKIINPKGKIYIGQSIDIERRFSEYKRLYCSQSKKLFYSLSKYGFDKHTFEIIEECDRDLLNVREEFYILKFNSHIDGLNIKLSSKPTWTGKKRPEHSEFLKQNGSGLSYERTQDHKDNLRDMMLKVWEDKGEEISKKISQNKIGKGVKSILCHETQIIYKSIKECSEKMNISKGLICSFVKGKYPYPTLKGFTFSYAKDFAP
jgi:group I intron endonuclease